MFVNIHDKYPNIMKTMTLIEQTENIKKITLPNFEMERYIKDLFEMFNFN